MFLDQYFFKTTKQAADVTSIKTINRTDSEKSERRTQNFERLRNYKRDTTNVATGTN